MICSYIVKLQSQCWNIKWIQDPKSLFNVVDDGQWTLRLPTQPSIYCNSCIYLVSHTCTIYMYLYMYVCT
jgi:hypothetical protein